MPSTEYNVDMILRRLPKESPESIVNVIDEIQKIVYSQDSFQTEKIESTGMPPYIVTTDGIYEYECPDDCRRTIAVFGLTVPRRTSRERPVGPRQEYYYRNRNYCKLAITTRDATIENNAKIYFQENPGDTTTAYYHHYYVKPTDLSDISIQLTLPEEVHYLLREAVVSMLTSDEYGKSQYDDAIMFKVVRKIRAQLNKGIGGSLGRTPPRDIAIDHEDHGYRRY